MMFARRYLCLLMVLPLCQAASGQENRDRKPNDSGNTPPKNSAAAFAGSPLFWRTDWILDTYVTQVTRHYNLTKDQEEYTRKLLGQRVKVFMQDHERDVRALVAQYMEYQMSQELPDPKTAKDFARRAMPLARQIRQEIFEGNMKWREVLDDDQRIKHDNDLKQMTNFFDGLEQGLDRWKDGKVQPTDLPGRLGQGRASVGTKPEDAWDFWIKRFIQSYKLDEGQQQTATSILRELKEEAARYREANKEKFAELEAAMKEIRQRSPKTEPEELAKYQEETGRLSKQRADLERPIAALFDQLRSRVEAIPTMEQRKARQAEIDRIIAQSRQKTTTQPVVVATKPAAETQAAAAAKTGE